ncbi:MAG TPA: hypothetical protein VM677_14265, partial [Actinokineospora sp.]|nr:hypothetical protein [Actinokineospora sp.]
TYLTSPSRRGRNLGAAFALVDGFGGKLAGQVAAVLGGETRIVPLRDVTTGHDCLVVLLPLGVGPLSYEMHETLAVLTTIAADAEIAAGFDSGIVVVWCVTAADRRELAVRRTVTADHWNNTALLNGTA